jgi:hypothetical protein
MQYRIRLSPGLISLIFVAINLIAGCSSDTGHNSSSVEEPLFGLLPAEKTHVDFNNELEESLNMNVLMYEYYYNGGGVAVGDVNGDGLQDLYFSGNVVNNRLYLNKGNMQFEDVTDQAGVAGRPGPGKPACAWLI